jgi:hypothetical protein
VKPAAFQSRSSSQSHPTVRPLRSLACGSFIFTHKDTVGPATACFAICARAHKSTVTTCNAVGFYSLFARLFIFPLLVVYRREKP